jgi:hypothetical protein
MKRFIEDQLIAWKGRRRRKPLILRGARQVGKSWSVADFGKRHFDRIHTVNLEKRPDWHGIFEGTLAARRILSQLEVVLNARIVPGKDLLFIDEIQSCPRAILALRYFLEDCPGLHVIAAGSLLEFVFKEISFPVGRIQFLEMFPMTFAEFLLATGKDKAAGIVTAPPSLQPESVHRMLLEELRNYFFVGGMPESVNAYAETGSFREAFDVHAEIVSTYREDFSKYAPYSDKRCLNTVLSNVARSIGSQIKYTRLAEGFSVPTIKKAFELLCMARVTHKVRACSPAGVPLESTANEKKFKALLVDLGLMQHLSGINPDLETAQADLLGLYEGAMAEQFVGQELLACGQTGPYFWAREARGSMAEVDFLVTLGRTIAPIEIKSGSAGRLRSLHLLLQSYPKVRRGIVLSTATYAELADQKLLFLPLYFAGSLLTRLQ